MIATATIAMICTSEALLPQALRTVLDVKQLRGSIKVVDRNGFVA